MGSMDVDKNNAAKRTQHFLRTAQKVKREKLTWKAIWHERRPRNVGMKTA